MFDSFFQGKRIHRLLIIAGGGILIILITIAIIVAFVQVRPEPVSAEKTADTENSRLSSGLRVMDLYLDDELHQFFQRQAYPMRDPSSVWDKQEVEQYFIPVDEILYEYFQKKNDNYIKEIFSNIE